MLRVNQSVSWVVATLAGQDGEGRQVNRFFAVSVGEGRNVACRWKFPNVAIKSCFSFFTFIFATQVSQSSRVLFF